MKRTQLGPTLRVIVRTPSRYPDVARWHAYRARTDGVPVPPTPWTGPEPAKDGRPYPRYLGIHQVPNRLPLHLADIGLEGASC